MGNLTLSISPNGKPIRYLPSSIDVSESSNAAQLHKQLSKIVKLPPYQLRITLPTKIVIRNDASVSLGPALQGQLSIQVKNLGPQIQWSTVFVIEYLGPILVHTLLYTLQFASWSPLNTTNASPTSLQTLSFILIVLHFLKREWETLYVHRFSASTMPLSNLFRNSAHYWLGSGLAVGLELYSRFSLVDETSLLNSGESDSIFGWMSILGLALYVVGECCNLIAHQKLQALRPPGTTKRGIPHGFPLFDVVSCPNYMFEIISWIGVSLVSRSWACVIFTALAGATMGKWAKQKEMKYRAEFGTKYTQKKWVLFAPFY